MESTMFGFCKNIEGGEESLGGGFQDFYFHPEPWGSDSI